MVVGKGLGELSPVGECTIEGAFGPTLPPGVCGGPYPGRGRGGNEPPRYGLAACDVGEWVGGRLRMGLLLGLLEPAWLDSGGLLVEG